MADERRMVYSFHVADEDDSAAGKKQALWWQKNLYDEHEVCRPKMCERYFEHMKRHEDSVNRLCQLGHYSDAVEQAEYLINERGSACAPSPGMWPLNFIIMGADGSRTRVNSIMSEYLLGIESRYRQFLLALEELMEESTEYNLRYKDVRQAIIKMNNFKPKK
jgi:hypothetical protein